MTHNKALVEQNTAQLEQEYKALMDVAKSGTPSNAVAELLDNEYRNLMFTPTQLGGVLNIAPSNRAKEMRTLIAKFEEDTGEFIMSNTQGYKKFTAEEAEQFLDYYGHPSIRLRRERGEEYSTPIISVGSGKGGVGKTTTLIHEASECALDPNHLLRVIAIDRDAHQGSLGHCLSSVPDDYDFDSTLSLIVEYAHLTHEERLAEDVQNEIREKLKHYINESSIENLSFIASNKSDADLAIVMTEMMMGEGSQEDKINNAMTLFSDVIIEPLKSLYDIIFIDTSPFVDIAGAAALYASDNLMLVATPRTLDVKALATHRDTLIRYNKTFMPRSFNGWKNIISLVAKCPTNAAFRATAKSVNRSIKGMTTVIEECKPYEVAAEKKQPLQRLGTNHASGLKQQREKIEELHVEIIRDLLATAKG